MKMKIKEFFYCETHPKKISYDFLQGSPKIFAVHTRASSCTTISMFMIRANAATTTFGVNFKKMAESGFAVASELAKHGLQHHWVHVIHHGPLPVIHTNS
jgi:hypothetical protein